MLVLLYVGEVLNKATTTNLYKGSDAQYKLTHKSYIVAAIIFRPVFGVQSL
jgi:hypothetical protein